MRALHIISSIFTVYLVSISVQPKEDDEIEKDIF